jgi:hypothetical protein
MDFREYVEGSLWEHYYDAAISEADPGLRLRRIAEAQEAMLQRAAELEESKASDVQCQALEDAAGFLQKMKMASLYS